MKVTLSEKYREFDTLKSRFRDVLSTDSRFCLVGAPQYHDERKIFECPAVDKRLYVSDEIDIAIETAAANVFKTGGRIPSRIDFLRRTPDAGWLEAFFGVTPLPRPATERMLGAQHGASFVYSQNEIDGTVVVLLYPPHAENFKRLEKCIVLGYFKSPRYVDDTRIRKHVASLIHYQKFVGFGQSPTIRDRFAFWWLMKTRVVVWEGSADPTTLRRSDWLIAHGKKILITSVIMAGAVIALYFVGKLLLWFGFATLANILLRRSAP